MFDLDINILRPKRKSAGYFVGYCPKCKERVFFYKPKYKDKFGIGFVLCAMCEVRIDGTMVYETDASTIG